MSPILRRLATLSLFALLLAPSLACIAKGSTTIVGWDFQGTAATTSTALVTSAPVADSGTPSLGTASTLGMTNSYTATGGITGATDGSNIEGADPQITTDTSGTNFAWRVVAGAGSAPKNGNGWSSQAPIGTQGAQFMVNTTGFGAITVQFDWGATTQGEANLEVLYTLDGTTWTNIPVAFTGAANPMTAGQTAALTVQVNSSSSNTVAGSYAKGLSAKGAWYTNLVVNFSAIPGAFNNPNFGVRFVNASTGADCIAQAGTALNNTSGNWRFDNVKVLGTPLAFTSGHLILSRSTYSNTGAVASLAVGSPLPDSPDGVTPFLASATGAYPTVFNNDTVDANFGVTSPAFLDEITTTGAVVATFAVPTNMMVTSFPSKSEMGLTLSADGQYLTFMGYAAAVGSLDISNSNTPAIIEPGNFVTATPTYREVVQVDSYGNFQTTTTNAYAGNNGRNAVLANGVYFTVGNAGAGNGSTQITAATGLQFVIPGQNATSSTPGTTQVGFYNITQNGFTADKPPKDNNFRGRTIFNNTLYISKGSGGNGINTVYRVGTAGTLPTLGQAGAVPITVLPGFPLVLSSASTGVSHPFGLWFANANTLYVADEGDGISADLNNGNDPKSGLQKWVLSNGTWSLAYTLQSGLQLGTTYTPNDGNGHNYFPTVTDGLRQITGTVNNNGTVTIYAVTSTASTSGDPGADPNRLVTITDTVAFTTGTQAASEAFTTLSSAPYGQVYRGISFAPVPAAVSAPTIISQPAGGTVFVGGSTTLSVSASGNPAPTYQWFLGTNPITGATSSTLALTNVQTSNAGSYTVVVTNGQGSITSNAAVIVVSQPVSPSISAQPTSQAATDGSTVTLSVTATSTPSPTYQWFYNGSAITGANASTFSLVVTSASAGAYTVSVSNSVTTVTSNAANVTANASNLGTVISGWDFQNLPLATDLTPVPDLGSATAGAASTLGMNNTYPTPNSSIDISDVEGGGGSDVGSSDPAGQNNQAWRVRGGPGVLGQVSNGWSSLAPIGTQGAQFLVSTAGYGHIKLTFDVETTAKAEGNLEVLYTVDGSTWVNVPISLTTTPPSGNTATAKVNSSSANTVQGAYINLAGGGAWFNGIVADFSGIPAAANNPNFGVRIVNASTGVDCISQSGAAYNNSSGNWRFDEVQVLGAATAPVITVQPQNTTAIAGTSPVLSVTVAGPTPTYQWYLNGTAVSGATGATYTVAGALAANAGSYTVVVTNGFGNTTSAAATLTINASGQSITFAPITGVTVGVPVTLSASTNSSLPVTFTIASGNATITNGTTLVVNDTNPVTVMASQPGNALYAAAPTVDQMIRAAAGGTQVFFGQISSGAHTSSSGPVPRSASAATSVAAFVNGSGTSGTLIGYISSISAGFDVNFTLTNGAFTAVTNAITGIGSVGRTLTFVGTNANGVVSGTINELGLTFSAAVEPTTGSSPAVSGLYQAAGTKAATYSIVGTQGDVFMLAVTASGIGAGTGTVSSNDTFTVQTTLGTSEAIAGSVNPSTSIIAGTITAGSGSPVSYSGESSAIAPAVTPSSQTVPAGSTASLAISNAPAGSTYQWQFNGANITGATGATLTLPTIATTQAGAYSVLVTSSGTTAVSSSGTVAVWTNTWLGNLSARAYVAPTLGSGDVLIAGFVTSGSKQILVRADGPALGAFGLTGFLTNPQLTLYSSSAAPVVKISWDSSLSSLFTSLGAFGLTSGSADAAISSSLAAGAYTAQVGSANGQNGTALAEIYDADLVPPAGHIINLSGRAYVGTGSNILIGGFVIGAPSSGGTSETVLIRAVGPSLASAPFNLTGALATPTLTVYDGASSARVIATISGWGAAPTAGTSPVAAGLQPASASAMATVGAFALGSGSADSAMVLTLPPGSYTAEVSGAAGTTGIALVEIYEIP